MLRARQPAAILFDATGGVTADLTATLGGISLTADATVPVVADLSVTLGGISLNADATVPVVGDLSATLGGISLVADATVAALVADLNVTLGGIQLTADATVPVVILDDTHDGDFLRKKFKRERKAVAARRQRVLDLYEQIIEGKQPEPEVVALVQAAGIITASDIIEAPAISLNSLVANLERAQALARDLAIEADDEEVLLLI